MSTSETATWTSLEQDLVQVQVMVFVLDSLFQKLLCETIRPEALSGDQDWAHGHKMGMDKATEDLLPIWMGSMLRVDADEGPIVPVTLSHRSSIYKVLLIGAL